MDGCIMGFNIRPGMSCWQQMPKKYKEEYYVYANRMKKRKEENYRENLKMVNKENDEKHKIKKLSRNASNTEKKWYSWMNYE